jgi:hypothetical protein
MMLAIISRRVGHRLRHILYFTSPLRYPLKVLRGNFRVGRMPRRLLDTMSEMDVSHDENRWLSSSECRPDACSRHRDASNSGSRSITQTNWMPQFAPRWSPDDSAVAFVTSERRWSDNLFSVNSSGGPPRQLTYDEVLMKGYAWLPDGSGVVYSSSRGSTLLYLPTLHLWRISTRGGDAQQLTFGDESDESPDLNSAGRIVASRRRMGFDIWKFPVDSNPIENVRRAVRITHQTAR